MQKLYKLQLIVMSPLLVLSLFIIVPVYYICKFINFLLDKKTQTLAYHKL
jgi:hypothetical protein